MKQVLTGVLIGLAGGLGFALLNLPAPWLAGSMIAALIAIFAGVKIGMPDWLRTIAFILLGIQTGTSVNWQTLERAAQWPVSIAFLAVTIVAVTWGSYVYYVRRRGWDQVTAFFASVPGALGLVLMLADTARADMRRVTISQSIRLFFLVAMLPAVIESMSPPHVIVIPPVTGGIMDVAILLLAAGAAGLLFDRFKVPAGLILGSAMVSAVLGLTGVIHGATPQSVLIPANVILGVMIASRFEHFSLAELKHFLAEGFSGFLIALAISSVGAAITAAVAGLPFALTLLAFSPGGLEAMTIMAFALNLDPAYVGAHQIARYVGMCIVLPPLVSWLLERRRSL